MLTCATLKLALWDIPLYYDKGSNNKYFDPASQYQNTIMNKSIYTI